MPQFHPTGSLGEQLFAVCSDLEAIRQKASSGYQLLKEIIEFASKRGINPKQIAELISRPPKLSVNEEAAQYLITSKNRIFSEPTAAEAEGDDNLLRCRSKDIRDKVQMTRDAEKQLRET